MRDYPNYPSYPSVTAVVREVVKHAGNGVPAKQVADTVGLPYRPLWPSSDAAPDTSWMPTFCCP